MKNKTSDKQLKKVAKRLCDYLEDDLGWNVYPEDRLECPDCGYYVFDSLETANFCIKCGSALEETKDWRKGTIIDVRDALKYALKL